MNTLFSQKNYVQKYISIVLAFFTALWAPLIYRNIMGIPIELGIEHWLIMTFIISLLWALITLLCYHIFFSIIFSIHNAIARFFISYIWYEQ
jgi:hypothetical protein